MNVHHITAGRADKNLGKAINDLVIGVGENDWICLRDIDTMPSYHEVFFDQVETIARKTDFDLIGCMTNRCGMKDQLLSGDRDIIEDDMNMANLRLNGKIRYNHFKYNVKPIDTTIAGVMMLFSKKTWMSVGGFREGGIRVDGKFVDWHFCNDIMKKGGKIGVATGIYMIHMYRPDHANPRQYTKHLE